MIEQCIVRSFNCYKISLALKTSSFFFSFIAVLIIATCLVAVTLAQFPNRDIIIEYLPNGQMVCRENCRRPLNQCPPVNCPQPDQPAFNGQCGMPNCGLAATQPFLWPDTNPNNYYQCRRADALGNWEAVRRICGCMTFFDYEEQRCVHPHEYVNRCNNPMVPRPSPTPCPIECPTCDQNGIPTLPTNPTNFPTIPTTAPTVRPPVTNPITTINQENTTRGPNNCQCPCAPCVWWPCKLIYYYKRL